MPHFAFNKEAPDQFARDKSWADRAGRVKERNS